MGDDLAKLTIFGKWWEDLAKLIIFPYWGDEIGSYGEFSTSMQGWKYRLKIDNRYRYSLLFCHRMQKFFPLFSSSIGSFPYFLRGKSTLINRYFFSEY